MAGREAPLGAAVYAALDRARRSLDAAIDEPAADQRYARAHVAALQATSAVLAARARPAGRGAQRSAWVLLGRMAPELAEWAAFFAAGAGKRAAAEAGLPHAVTDREAADLVRDAQRFLAVVERLLGVSTPLPEEHRLAS